MLISEVPPWGVWWCPGASLRKEAAFCWSHCQGQCVLFWKGSLGGASLSAVGTASNNSWGKSLHPLWPWEQGVKWRIVGPARGMATVGNFLLFGLFYHTSASIRILRCPTLGSLTWGEVVCLAACIYLWGIYYPQSCTKSAVSKKQTLPQKCQVLEHVGAARLGLSLLKKPLAS